MESVINKKIEGHVGILTISRPSALNALNTQVLEALEQALTEMEQSDIRVLLITGEGKAFVAGADIGEMQSLNAQQGEAFGRFGARVFRKLETLRMPTIAVINGYALGGGLELAMSCDLRLASLKAKLGQPETGLGITPGFSGTQRLPRLVGVARAKELIYTSKMIGAEKALEIGLLNGVYEPEALMTEAMNMAQEIAAKAPIAVANAKRAINGAMEMGIDEGIAMETYLFGLCFATEDQKEGMRAFLEKQPSNFKNR